MKKFFFTLIFTFGFITLGFPGDPPPFNPSGPNSIPVDGGSLLLLAAGFGYGVKKVNERKKSQKESE